MIRYKPYPKYMDSGVEWIGPVPEGWEVVRMKRAANLQADRRNSVPELWPYIGLEDVESGTGRYRPTQREARQTADSTVGIFAGGDVLYGKLRPYLRKAVVASDDGTCSTEFLVLRAVLGVEPNWLHQWLLTPEVTQQVEAGCYGAKMPRADWEHIGSLQIPIPPMSEQAAIGAKVNQGCGRIDALIAQKTHFIDLLREKRQALITHAVTKGLDPTVPMKESGQRWLGRIPVTWGCVGGNRLFSESQERAHTTDEHLSATQKYGVIPLAEYERREARQVTHAVKNLEQRKHVEIDDFVISMRSFEGGIERVKAVGCVRSSYVVLVGTSTADAGYFSYLFKSSAYIQALQATSTFVRDGQDLNYGNFRQVKVPCPLIETQREIASFLDEVIARIDALISKTERSIDLLCERRSAFITAAVTGRIDLRAEVDARRIEVA